MTYAIAEDGTPLFVQDLGSGPEIVFISSGNATHSMWGEQVVDLNDRFRTVTYDWRGTGKSGVSRAGYTGENAAKDLLAIIEELGLGPVLLVGHGMGGHVAVLAQEMAPEKVAGLALANTGPWYAGERDGLAGGMSQEFIDGSVAGTGLNYPDVLAKMTDDYLFHSTISDITRTATVLQQLEWPLAILDKYDRAMHEIDHRDRMPLISVPSLILHGRHDRKQRFEGALVMQGLIPNAELTIFEHSAHCPHAEETSMFNNALSQFANRVFNL